MVTIREIDSNLSKDCFLLDSKSIKLWSFKQWEDQLKKKDVKAFAIFDQEMFLGVCVCEIVLDEAELNFMAIQPKFTRKGLGHILLTKLLNVLKRDNIKKIFLEVSAKNIPAMKFYKAFGFKTINIRKNYYQDGSDAILKSKVIC